MGNDNELSVRIRLRYDSYTNWMNSSTILLSGEVAIAAIQRNSLLNTDDVPENTPPSIGIKVGDGFHTFDELPWLQAVAADVYNWAKTATKPTYTANEITGLAEYIAAHSSGGGGGGGAGSTGDYRVYYDSSSSKYILQYYDETDDEWKASTGDEINLSSILNRIDTIERWANGAKTHLGNIELPITAFVYDEVVSYLNKIDVNDTAVAHQFVTSVSQTDGKISVSRSIITASDIASGVFNTSQGGTGLTSVDSDQVLVGSHAGNITTKTFVTEIDPSDRASFATVGAIIDYIAEMTAGLTGAMHFVGESTVTIDTSINNHIDPQIPGYNFRQAQPGDVILANNAQEYVWSGTEWHLLGDEGSYVIKGRIVNSDISENANISQDKIDGLAAALADKVDKIDGKGLSTNDFTDEYKEELDNLDPNAQENVIEHIFVNNSELNIETISGNQKSVNIPVPEFSSEDLERLATAEANIIENIFINENEEPLTPTTIHDLPKSVKIEFTPYTPEEKEKLSNIEAEAQVNTVEKVTINGTLYEPDENKNIDITIDQAALNLDVITGARVPSTTSGQYEDVDITNSPKKLELSRISKTGLISDALQTNGTYFVIYCGTATEVV